MNDNDNWKLKAGGLFRCCTETVRQHDKPGTYEGERLPCLHCKDAVVWREDSRAWESQHAQKWEEDFRAFEQRRRDAGD